MEAAEVETDLSLIGGIQSEIHDLLVLSAPIVTDGAPPAGPPSRWQTKETLHASIQPEPGRTLGGGASGTPEVARSAASFGWSWWSRSVGEAEIDSPLELRGCAGRRRNETATPLRAVSPGTLFRNQVTTSKFIGEYRKGSSQNTSRQRTLSRCAATCIFLLQVSEKRIHLHFPIRHGMPSIVIMTGRIFPPRNGEIPPYSEA
jgi:hypothetical protein